jgi:CotS family spore coat protein
MKGTQKKGGSILYDRGLSVLEQYGLEARTTYRGRGSLICDTQEGLVMIKEFTGSSQKLEKQAQLLEAAAEKGQVQLDILLRNQEEQYLSFDKDNVGYYVKRWYAGRECDTRSREDIMCSIRALARLHQVLRMPWEENYVREPLQEEYTRHNREMRKIRKFIRKKQQKNSFENRYLESVDWFLEKGEDVVCKLESSGYGTLREQARKEGHVCHGEYNQHNILLLEDKEAVTNLDKWNFDVQMADLYQFMRKIMEKNDWNSQLGQQMIAEYDKYSPLRAEEYQNLQLRFAYPEKYWKLANHYYTRKKAWISQKDLEKLETIIEQKQKWAQFWMSMS